MIKKILLVILGIFILAAAVVTIHLPSRHFAFQVYGGIQLYQQLAEKYKTDPACESEDNTAGCMTKIVKDSGGFKFGTDFGVAMAVLINNKVSYDAFIRGNVALVNAVDPEKFWIKSVKGKAAKHIFIKEKKDLVKSFEGQKDQLVKTIASKRFPSSESDQRLLIQVIENKISELSK